tara:strand:+ start:99 stop:581 length:483 start_codon:yes stop_codon:yes gene_type:complete
MFSKREIIIWIFVFAVSIILAWELRLEGATMNENIKLFQTTDFKSHSGLDLSWKIECDALQDGEWFTLSKMIMELSPPFSKAVGIPRGGVKLGDLLNIHGTGKRTDPICIVDDVITTGESMNDFKRTKHWREPTEYIGWVVFARTTPPDWVNVLFQMPKI